MIPRSREGRQPNTSLQSLSGISSDLFQVLFSLEDHKLHARPAGNSKNSPAPGNLGNAQASSPQKDRFLPPGRTNQGGVLALVRRSTLTTTRTRSTWIKSFPVVFHLSILLGTAFLPRARRPNFRGRHGGQVGGGVFFHHAQEAFLPCFEGKSRLESPPISPFHRWVRFFLSGPVPKARKVP